MGNFSKNPLHVLNENLAKDYIGLHIQQGVPLLDRDLNLMQDFLLTMMRQLAAEFFGNGIFASAGNLGFKIEGVGASNDFRIHPGSAMADGIVVRMAAAIDYLANGGTPLTTPTAAQPNPRRDAVYLDVWLAEVTGAEDSMLNNEDIGVETAVRMRPAFRVRVHENEIEPPAPEAGHVHLPLAVLTRSLGDDRIIDSQVTDMRRVLLRLSDLELRLMAREQVGGPRITGIEPEIQDVGQSITIIGENFNNGGIEVTFIPLNSAVAPIARSIGSGHDATKIRVEVPDFPGTFGKLPCRIKVQNAAAHVFSNEVSTPFAVRDALP